MITRYDSTPDISDVVQGMPRRALENFLQYCAANVYTVTRSRLTAWIEREKAAGEYDDIQIGPAHLVQDDPSSEAS